MIGRVAAAAVERACVQLIAAARDELPADVAVERTAEGVALTGKALARRRIGDVRIRGFALGPWR